MIAPDGAGEPCVGATLGASKPDQPRRGYAKYTMAAGLDTARSSSDDGEALRR